MSNNHEKKLAILRKKWGEKELSALEAIQKYIHPGDRIYIEGACAEPESLMKALIEYSPKLPDVEIVHALSISDLDYYAASDSPDLFRYNAFFIGRSLRNYVMEGLADYTPMVLSEIPRIFKTGQIHLDSAIVQLSPPNKKGLCSLGINVDITKAMVESADHVIAEINPKLPRTNGDTFVNMDDVDAFVINEHELYEFNYGSSDIVAKRIGRHLSSIVENGSTIQIGIGKLPNTILPSLSKKKDLGVHSVVITDAILDLVEQGVITGKRKYINKGKIITSFALGTKRLFDFVDDNSEVEFHPCDYVNDPNVIGQNFKQVSINGAISVDITGQVNADSLGHKFYSGIGGLVDFTRGAARSVDGKPIIVLASTVTLPDGKLKSTIVPCLKSCSGVVLTRGMVHYVITEWGIAYLYGKNIRERVLQMINIAHPDFREELLEHAKNCNYVYKDQELPKTMHGRLVVYPEKYETKKTLRNGKTILIRPIKPSDERMIQELHYSLSKEEIYYRFFSHARDFRHTRIQPLVTIDYTTNMILVCVHSEGGKEEIIGTGGFFKTEDPSIVEMAYIVRKDWRGNGLTWILLKLLVDIARELKYKAFSGNIMLDNEPMMHILNTSEYELREKTIEEGVIKFIIDIQK